MQGLCAWKLVSGENTPNIPILTFVIDYLQIAFERTKPGGRIIGIDIIPAQPPKGVSAIQGNFLLPAVHNMVKDYLAEFPQRKSASGRNAAATEDDETALVEKPSYIDSERAESVDSDHGAGFHDGKLVDV